MSLTPREIYDVAVYCRLSSEDESRGDSVSIQNQREILTKYVTDNNWLVVDCYIDEGVT